MVLWTWPVDLSYTCSCRTSSPLHKSFFLQGLVCNGFLYDIYLVASYILNMGDINNGKKSECIGNLNHYYQFSKVLTKNSTKLINLIKNKAAFEEGLLLKKKMFKIVIKSKTFKNWIFLNSEISCILLKEREHVFYPLTIRKKGIKGLTFWLPTSFPEQREFCHIFTLTWGGDGGILISWLGK